MMKICEGCITEHWGCPKEDQDDIVDCFSMEYTYTATKSIEKCHHHKGYYHTVTFWIFKRRFLACELCGELIPQGRWYI